MLKIQKLLKMFEEIRSKPVIFVIGCTGTGKSDLGIEICKKYNGEVISVDSMQFYKGMDIATNKVTLEEADGVQHHMMSFLEPSTAQKYNVHDFRKQVLSIIEGLHTKQKIPVIVGGTTYYAESILYQDNFIETSNNSHDDVSSSGDEKEDIHDLQALSNQELWDLLNLNDPESARLVHPNNRERVRRAVEIHRLTGKRKSELIKEQKKNDQDLTAKLRFENSLVLYLDATPDVLNERLDGRVDKMVKLGLKRELVDFYEQHKEVCSSSPYGVMQCIGLKEFIPWLELGQEERENTVGEKVFRQCGEDVKLHTRQYAKRQRRWFHSRLLRRRSSQQTASIRTIDTSDKKTIISSGMSVVDKWMRGEDFSETVNDDENAETGEEANRLFKCEICEMTVSGRRNWEKHVAGKKHKHSLKTSKSEEKFNSS